MMRIRTAMAAMVLAVVSVGLETGLAAEPGPAPAAKPAPLRSVEAVAKPATAKPRTPVTAEAKPAEAKPAEAKGLSAEAKAPSAEPRGAEPKAPTAIAKVPTEEPAEVPEVKPADPHGASAHGPAGDVAPQPTAQEVISQLEAGNTRFADGAMRGERRDEARRCETSAGQHPVAGVLSCADSRVPVEVVFDQGVGDLFVIRVAGNVAGTSELASLEYGVEHLKFPVIVVMGHSRCGAVKAAVEGVQAEGSLGELLADVKPAAEDARAAMPGSGEAGSAPPALLSAAVRANVRRTMKMLTSAAPCSRRRWRRTGLRSSGRSTTSTRGRSAGSNPGRRRRSLVSGEKTKLRW